MWLQARLTRKELTAVVSALAPVRFGLGAPEPRGYLHLDPPSRVDLRAGDAVYLETTGRVTWDVAGLPLPLRLRSLHVRVVPSIETIDGRQCLTLLAQIDSVDLSALPGVVETALMTHVNAALREERARLLWRFTRTLDFTLRMPAKSEPRRQVRLHAVAGNVRVTADALLADAAIEVSVQSAGAALNAAPLDDDQRIDPDAVARWVGEGGAGDDPVRPIARAAVVHGNGRSRKRFAVVAASILGALAAGAWLRHTRHARVFASLRRA